VVPTTSSQDNSISRGGSSLPAVVPPVEQDQEQLSPIIDPHVIDNEENREVGEHLFVGKW
jgi:hypothetical protein